MRSSLSISSSLWLSAAVLAAGGAAVAACGFTPSHAPLGGDYSTPETASVAPRKPQVEASATVLEDAGTGPATPERHAPLASAGPDAGVAPASADAVHYDPLKTGDQIRAELAIAFSADLQASSVELHSKDNAIVLEAKLRADVKVLRSSAQSLDELEVTLTPISLHTDFDGRSSDTKQDPPETFDITLSGQSPSIRVQSGAALEKEARITLIVLLTPLVEFHNHWARSPTLALKPGWSSKVPLTPPAFMPAQTENVRVGALSVRYDGRDAGAASTPFELNLPIHWSTDFGTLDLECSGRALLGAKGRPLSLDLTSPITGSVGPPGSQLALRGNAKFAVSLSYP